RRLEGSTARTPTECPRLRSAAARTLTSVLFPTPGGPVSPMRCPSALPPASAVSNAATSGRAWGRRSSTRLSARATALRSPARTPGTRDATRSARALVSGGSGEPMSAPNQLDQVVHDRSEGEVLRRVDSRDAESLQGARVVVRNDAADDDRHVRQPRGSA